MIRDAQNVYIDLGANWGQTLRQYRQFNKTANFKVGRRPWEIYAFEADPLIQPYLERFVLALNGAGRRPKVTVPPVGSSAHLAALAPRFDCQGVRWWVRTCMTARFREPLQRLRADPALADPGFLSERLASASNRAARTREESVTHTQTQTRRDSFHAIHAAASARNWTLQLCRSLQLPGFARNCTSEERLKGRGMTVPIVDFVSWLAASFSVRDNIIVNMDIEGDEFRLLPALLKLSGGKRHLIDMLHLECHGDGGGHLDALCHRLIARLRRETGTFVLSNFDEGYMDDHDKLSGPGLYHP
ncbi:unnamed protein product, partial [Polarella glacialis]